MILLNKTVPDTFNLFLFGDLHVGSLLTHYDGIFQLTDAINSTYDGVPAKCNFCLNHGDSIEAITQDDKRFDPTTTKQTSIIKQVESVVELLQPIRDKLIGVLQGNHELKLWRYGDLTEDIASRLNVPYLTYSAKITYRNRHGEIFKHFAAHGFGSVNSAADDIERQLANMRIALKRKLRKKAGDTALMSMGHTHKLIVTKPKPELYLTDDGNMIHQNYTGPQQTGFIHPDNRFYANTGSFLRLYGPGGVSGYAEIAGYDPVELGYCVARIRDRQLVGVDTVVVHEKAEAA